MIACAECGYSRVDTLNDAEWLGIPPSQAVCCEMDGIEGDRAPDVHTALTMEFEGDWWV